MSADMTDDPGLIALSGHDGFCEDVNGARLGDATDVTSELDVSRRANLVLRIGRPDPVDSGGGAFADADGAAAEAATEADAGTGVEADADAGAEAEAAAESTPASVRTSGPVGSSPFIDSGRNEQILRWRLLLDLNQHPAQVPLHFARRRGAALGATTHCLQTPLPEAQTWQGPSLEMSPVRYRATE